MIEERQTYHVEGGINDRGKRMGHGHFTCSLTCQISYVKTLSTLPGVRLVFEILSQLNILCISKVILR